MAFTLYIQFFAKKFRIRSKAIYAYAGVNKEARKGASEYFHEAVATIRANKELYQQAQSNSRKRADSTASFGVPFMIAQQLAKSRIAADGNKPD